MSNNPSDQENHFEQSIPLLYPLLHEENDFPIQNQEGKKSPKSPPSSSMTNQKNTTTNTTAATTSTTTFNPLQPKGFTDYGSIPLTEQNLQTKNFSEKNSLQKRGTATAATAAGLTIPPQTIDGENQMKQAGKLLDLKSTVSVDDFGDTNSLADFKLSSFRQQSKKAIRSGRQRKKTAARSKGGEFQAKRKKRRIYFCSIGSEIDVEGLADNFLENAFLGLRGKMYSEVLHLYVENIPSSSRKKEVVHEEIIEGLFLIDNPSPTSVPHNPKTPPLSGSFRKRNSKEPLEENEIVNPLFADDNPHPNQLKLQDENEDEEVRGRSSQHNLYTIEEGGNFTEEEDEIREIPQKMLIPPRLSKPIRSSSYPGSSYPVNNDREGEYDSDAFSSSRPNPERTESFDNDLDDGLLPTLTEADHLRDDHSGDHHLEDPPSQRPSITRYPPMEVGEDEIVANSHYWHHGGREVFVFDFGAVVFWGYHRDEVQDLLKFFSTFIVKGKLSEDEFKAGEDDMAFVLSAEAEAITIANDVITLPEITSVKSRLAVSFAIAQSTILAIFEARIEEKVEDYKYIPEALSLSGNIELSAKELGTMIGEVFVIRHDVNLHNEILNIPDYFWKENSVEPLYRMTSMYLEMEPRTEVLNKRLDLLRELLKLLQHQHENSHNIKLEWIIIWLIVISVVLELFVMVGKLLKLWD